MLPYLFFSLVSCILSCKAEVVVIPIDQALPKPYNGTTPVSDVRDMLFLTDEPSRTKFTFDSGLSQC